MDKGIVRLLAPNANDLRKEFQNRDDVEEFNQAIMRLTNAAQELHVVDSFSEIKEE